MTLPKWVQGPSKKTFIGNPSSATVYFSMTSKFSEMPYILATIQVALAFNEVKIVIPDTLQYYIQSLHPDNQLKSQQALYDELRGLGKAFYKRNLSHFQPLIDKVGQEEWEKNYLKYWDDYRFKQEFVEAKEVIRKICAYEKEESNGLVAKVNNSLTDDANIFTLSQAIERTAQTRLNCLWATKNKKYDLSSSMGIQIINYIYDELAQLLVEALEIKARIENQSTDNVNGHAILYAGKLSPATYKLFQLIKSKDEHKYFSPINSLLKLYKIPEYVMQPLSINWNAKEVQEILKEFQSSISKQEANNKLTQQSIQNGCPISVPIAISQTSSAPIEVAKAESPPDGPSFEELLSQTYKWGAELLLKDVVDPSEKPLLIASYSASFAVAAKFTLFSYTSFINNQKNKQVELQQNKTDETQQRKIHPE